MKTKWVARLATAGTVLVAGVLAPSLALAGSVKAGGAANPQTTAGRVIPNTVVAPDTCLQYQQTSTAEQRYRKTYNAYRTYAAATVHADYFDVACGSLTFTVPAGKQALVDLSATGELDCQGAAGGNTWCEGRFLVNGTPLPTPDNTGRSDTYAWDSGNGGMFDWQAHSLDMEYNATCAANARNTPCSYRVQLQSRLDNGATAIWIDDLTVRADVTLGAVRVTPVNP